MAPTSGRQSGTNVTMQGSAVGTPAYMAPEQSADATSVDHRADIYSLGCSLFYLLAGRSPYDGTVVSEVLEKHAKAPVPDLAEINQRVPAQLCRTVERSMAKRADERFPSLAEMIRELEAFLGIESTSGFSPTSDQADRWEQIAETYGKSQRLRMLGPPLMMGLVTLSILATLAVPFFWIWGILLGPTLFLTACAAAVGLDASTGSNAVAAHLRRWTGSLTWLESAIGVFAGTIFLLVTVVSGLWLGAFVGAILGAGLGAAYHFGIVGVAAKSGQPAMEDAKKFVRDLRIDGAEEEGLRDFLARYAGKGWQAIYEALFGYDALNEMRSRLAADAAFDGPTSDRSMRDRFCKWLNEKIETKKQERDQSKLARLEQQSLLSQGVSESDAKEQGWQMAGAIIENSQMPFDPNSANFREAAEAKRARIKAMLAEARSGRYKKRDQLAPVKFAFGGYVRMLAGCILLGVFAIAAQATGLLTEDTLQQVQQQVQSGGIDLDALPGDATTDTLGQSTSIWSVAIAGLLLCLSAFVGGTWRITPFAIVATLVVLFGAGFGIPPVGPASAWMVAAAIGMVLYVPGILFAGARS